MQPKEDVSEIFQFSHPKFVYSNIIVQMLKIHTVLSQEELVEQVKSHKEYYNNTQNVEGRRIDPNLASNDVEMLGQLGYKQELKRHFQPFNVLEWHSPSWDYCQV